MRRRRLGTAFLRAIAGPLAVVLLAGTAVAGPADTRSEITEAKRRLKTLEAQISTQQSRVLSITESLRELAADVGRSRRALEAIQDRLGLTKMLRMAAETRYGQIRGEIDRAASDAYMRGPGYELTAVFDLDSLSDVADLISYTSSIAARNAELAEEVNRLGMELAKREREETILTSERSAVLSRLTREQDELTERFAEQQLRLSELNRSRAEVGSLLTRLRARLRAEEIAAAEQAIARGTPLTFGQWAQAFLDEIHSPLARNNLIVMVAWQVAEYTTARWNPLATTYPMPGSTIYNGHGVRNYVSLGQGLDATRLTLTHCCYGYEQILTNLARNADPMTTAEAINRSRWCRGCADGGYVVDLIPTVEHYYDDYANDHA